MPSRPKREATMKKGDKVEAKWSGSSMYYPATIIEVSGKQCKVQFKDGSISSVKVADLKPDSATESAAPRTRSRSRSKGRTTRARSPSRSPSRRSTSTKTEKKAAPTKTVAPQTRLRSSNHADEPKLKLPEVEVREALVKIKPADIITPSSLARMSIFSNSSVEKVVYSDVFEGLRNEDNSLNLRTSARIAAMQMAKAAAAVSEPAVERRVHVETSKFESKDRMYMKDDEESGEDETDDIAQKKPPQKTFSVLSLIVALLKVFYLPVSILFFCLACVKKPCTIYEVPPAYGRWKEFENDVKMPLLVCAAFHLFLSLLSKVPIGYLVTKYVSSPKGKTAQKYRLNGFVLLLVSVAIYGVFFYFNYYATWPVNKIKAIVISSLMYTTLWSIIVHFYGALKKYDSSEMRPFHRCSFVGNFYYGHEVNPWLFGWEDIKTRFIQFGLISLVLIDLSIVGKFFLMKGFLSIPLLLTVSMHILFVLHYFLREECMLSSATYTDDGVGFGFIVGIGTVIPHSFALQTLFLMHHADKSVHLPHWCSGAIAVLFLCGLYIYDSSNRLKHNFRKSPFSSSMSKVMSIPTSKSRRLIISGLWGVVRHPNYLGLLIMIIACCLPCGFTHALPYMPLLFFMILLTLRSLKVEGMCQDKYGPAWQNYRDIVRSRIIPYIF